MKTVQVFGILLFAALISFAAPPPKNNSPHKTKQGQQSEMTGAKVPFMFGEHGMKAPASPEKKTAPEARPVDRREPAPEAHPGNHRNPAPSRSVDRRDPVHFFPGHKMEHPGPKVHLEAPPPPPPPPAFQLQIPHPLGATTPEGWFDDWNAASMEARRLNRPMLVLFTGSDWCYWCKVLHKEVLNAPAFRNFASQKLLLVYMDQPSKVNLPPTLKRTRDQLALLLQAGDGVPYTVILSPDGRRWEEIGGYTENYLEIIREILRRHGY